LTTDTDETTIVVPGSEDVAADLNAPSKPNGAAKNVAEDAAADLRRQIDEAKAQTAREKAAREEAERRARAAESRVGQSETEARSSTLTAVANAIEARTGALAAAQAAVAAAWSEGDFTKAAEANTRVGQLTAELLRLNEAKDYAEQQAKNPPRQQIQTGQADGVEGFIQRANLPPKSAAWLRENPKVLDKQAKLARAHEEAMEEVGQSGFESPEYFGIIEKIMGVEKKSQPSTEVEDEEHERRAPVRQQEQRRPPAAPPSSGASAGSRGKEAVRLTPEMRRAAEISGVSEEEYAKNRLELIRQGLIS
jgi:hypothetical protein